MGPSRKRVMSSAQTDSRGSYSIGLETIFSINYFYKFLLKKKKIIDFLTTFFISYESNINIFLKWSLKNALRG